MDGPDPWSLDAKYPLHFGKETVGIELVMHENLWINWRPIIKFDGTSETFWNQLVNRPLPCNAQIHTLTEVELNASGHDEDDMYFELQDEYVQECVPSISKTLDETDREISMALGSCSRFSSTTSSLGLSSLVAP